MADAGHSDPPERGAEPPEPGNLDRGGALSERLIAWIGRTTRGFFAWVRRFSRESARAWKYLDGDQRVAAVGALLLIVSTFGSNFSFVEAAVALVGLAVLILLKKRADGRQFHLPFGDGAVIMLAGAWSALLIIIRLFDRPLGQNMLALVCAAIIVIAGLRIRVRRPIDDLPATRADAAAKAAGVVPPRGGVELDLAAHGDTAETRALTRDETRTRALPASDPPREETAQRPRPRTPAARRSAGRPKPLDLPPPPAPDPPPEAPDLDLDLDPDFDFAPPPPPPPPAAPEPDAPDESGPFRARRAAPSAPPNAEDATSRLPGRRPPRRDP